MFRLLSQLIVSARGQEALSLAVRRVYVANVGLPLLICRRMKCCCQNSGQKTCQKIFKSVYRNTK